VCLEFAQPKSKHILLQPEKYKASPCPNKIALLCEGMYVHRWKSI